jgi:hypothetical protein
MPRVPSVAFGVSPGQYDEGVQASCAINDRNRFIEVHRGKSDAERTLNFRVATVRGASVNFSETRPPAFGPGQNPTVAITSGNVVIEAHDDDSNLYYSIYTLAANTLTKVTDGQITPQDASSSDPTIAVNAGGAIVEIHQAGNNLRWRLGQLTGTAITWYGTHPLVQASSAVHPVINASVSINDSGNVVVAYQIGNDLYALTGSYTAGATAGTEGSIAWHTEANKASYVTGVHPSVAVSADRWIYEVHKSETVDRLYQRIGRLSDDGKTIDWKAWLGGDRTSHVYDDGGRPAIAANAKVAVQVHGSETAKTLFATASLVFDRANWIGDYRRPLRNKRLKELVLPASHDAGSYIEDDPLATQTLPIFGQLASGVRYFDLRPVKVRGGAYKIHHDDFLGVDLQDVITDVRNFMKDHNELVILKFSHYGTTKYPFTQAHFNGLVTLLLDPQNGIPRWLLKIDPPQRLGETTLSELVGPNIGTVLVVADAGTETKDGKTTPVEFVNTTAHDGIRRYRDWYAPDPQNGDLTVFDIFGNTPDYPVMTDGTGDDPDPLATKPNGTRLERGQFPKFDFFNGTCRNKSPQNTSVPCDLFLLSWTLTPPAGGAVRKSRDANKHLVDASVAHPDAANATKFFNLLYTDVVQESRSTDVALLRNGLV